MRYQPIRFELEKLDNQTGILKMLLLLKKYGELYNKQIIDLGMNDRTIKNARKELLDLKLIRIEERKAGRFTRLFHILTENGTEIATLIEEIEKKLTTESNLH